VGGKEIPIRPNRWLDVGNVHTFGRRGGGINIAYLFHYKSGAKPLMAAMWFEGSAADCERIEAIAREHLPSYDWRVPYESEEHGRWDSMWARDWGD
jgi:hypothetical protein